MDGGAQLIWGMLFGAVGIGYFVYGKKQQAVVPLVAGISLCVFPYFISNVYLLVITGAILSAAPFFIKI